MTAVLALVAEILGMAPQIASAGIELADLYQKVRDVLDATTAPDDATWAALDQQVRDLQASLAIDPGDSVTS